MINCRFCGKEVVPTRDYQLAVGWVKPRAKGLNHLWHRKDLGVWAHLVCLEPPDTEELDLGLDAISP